MKRFSTLFFILFAVSVFIPIGYGQFQPEDPPADPPGVPDRSFLDVTIKVPSDVQNGAFNARIRFIEEVLDFVQSDVILTGTATASITGWVSTEDVIFIATITPVTSGTVIISVPADVATDGGGNQNNAATPQTVTVDVDAPSVGITVPSVAQSGAFEATITFTESVSDFEQADLTLSGTATATVTAWDTTDNTVFTATITPTTEGDVVLSVAANVATDAASNNNTASETQTVTVDMTPPGVSLSVPEGAQNGAFNVTITFTEAVSGFEQADLSVSGTATASITAWTTTDNTVFTATITPTTSGTVILDIAAEVATDAANNNNTASETQTVTVDVDAPGVSISVPKSILTEAFDVVITFTEPVLDFEQSDLSVSGTATASITAWSSTDDTVFTATITATTSGDVTLSVAADVATDAARNNNTASNSQTVTVTVEPETVWIPDANLRSAVRNKLGLAVDEALTKTKMLELAFLSARNSEIADLTGLEHATNLTSLWLNDNSISDIKPLKDLTSLKVLWLSSNSASDIKPLKDLTSLRVLYLSSNSISDINSLEDLTNLRTLWLNANSISDIKPLKDLTNLTSLYLGNNSIIDVSHLSELTSLTTLWLNANSIIDVSHLSKLTSLTTLYLLSNSISDINSLKDLTSLTTLSLNDNSIINVSVLEDLTNLTELHLGKNSISDISPLEDLTSLTSLYLQDNSIIDVSHLSDLTSLTHLSLKNNPISDTSPLYDLLSENDGTITYIDIDVSRYAPWDVNKDESVDASDVALVTAALGQSGADIIDSRTDVNGDGTVDADDLTLVTENLDADDEAAPSAMGGIASLLDRAVLESLDPETLTEHLSMLRSKNDGSLKYQRAIALLESLLASMRPAETSLLANYPNPFNPETWIPYHLANACTVVITIYDVRGTVVRRLELGHQREGYYTSRVRAAYWDGKNNVGERVASGIYFYQLQADNMSLLRKMVILQ